MISKVLVVGTPSEGLRSGLKGVSEVQNSLTPADALRFLSGTSFLGLICCLPSAAEAADFIRKAVTLHPRLRTVLMVNPAWPDETIPKFPTGTVLLLPADIRPAIAEANLRQFFGKERGSSPATDLLQGSVVGAVTALFEVLSIVDPYSASLGQRLRYAADLFCKSAGIPMEWELETGALLAEIGMLTIPVRVITRAHAGQELTTFERDMMAHIPERGADLLQHIPALADTARIVRFQGKNYDGSGLPVESLSGERIPRGARILKVLNDLFKLRESGRTQDESISEMENRHTRYDPNFLAIAQECFKVSLPSQISGSSVATNLKDLRPGQLLVSNVETDDGVLVIRDGQVISPRLLHKLRNFAFTSGIREPIYVIDLLESREMTTRFQSMAQSDTAFFIKNS